MCLTADFYIKMHDFRTNQKLAMQISGQGSTQCVTVCWCVCRVKREMVPFWIIHDLNWMGNVAVCQTPTMRALGESETWRVEGLTSGNQFCCMSLNMFVESACERAGGAKCRSPYS